MLYRLEAAVAEGGRQSKGCYHRFLGVLNGVYSRPSNPAGRHALLTCKVLLTPYFPVNRGRGGPKQMQRTHMELLITDLKIALHALILSGHIRTTILFESVNIYLWKPLVQTEVN